MFKGTTYTCQIDKDKARGRADKILTETLDRVSRARLQNLMREGYVRCDGNPVFDVSVKVKAGQVWVVQVPLPIPARPEPRLIPINVVFEDPHLIVIEKPAGMVVHPAAGHSNDTLVNALLYHCKGSLSGIGGVTRPGIVHRLDKDTSGLIVAAKNDAAHRGLAEQFAAHSIERTYLAVVSGRLENQTGTIDGLIGRSSKNRKKMAVLKRYGKFARTHYRVLGSYNDLISLVECRLETGRTHQIRVHMASIGHSILGDIVYGRSKNYTALGGQLIDKVLKAAKRQLLHAKTLGFTHPISGQSLMFVSENFPEIKDLFPNLMFD